MRSALKWTIRVSLAVLSLESVARLADYSGEIEWWSTTLAHHPLLNAVVRGPIFPLLLAGVCLLSVYGEKFLKQPDLKSRFIRIRLYPRVGIVGLLMMDEIMEKVLKKKTYGYDCDLLVELSIVNESDTPVTIDGFDVELLDDKRVIPTREINDVSTFRLDFGEVTVREKGRSVLRNHREPLNDLKSELRGIPLTKGIGHKGWIRFEVKDFDRTKMETAKLKLCVVDAFESRHPVTIKKGTALDSSGSLVDLSDVQLS
jgi:hypothetical protein